MVRPILRAVVWSKARVVTSKAPSRAAARLRDAVEPQVDRARMTRPGGHEDASIQPIVVAGRSEERRRCLEVVFRDRRHRLRRDAELPLPGRDEQPAVPRIVLYTIVRPHEIGRLGHRHAVAAHELPVSTAATTVPRHVGPENVPSTIGVIRRRPSVSRLPRHLAELGLRGPTNSRSGSTSGIRRSQVPISLRRSLPSRARRSRRRSRTRSARAPSQTDGCAMQSTVVALQASPAPVGLFAIHEVVHLDGLSLVFEAAGEHRRVVAVTGTNRSRSVCFEDRSR